MNENSLPDALISHSGPLHSSVKVSYCICKSVSTISAITFTALVYDTSIAASCTIIHMAPCPAYDCAAPLPY